MMKKILTDCDGVLLDWETAFHDWMVNKGYSKVVHDTYNLDVA
jgi:FMN phosphatase YigB (HAD superfamily)